MDAEDFVLFFLYVHFSIACESTQEYEYLELLTEFSAWTSLAQAGV